MEDVEKKQWEVTTASPHEQHYEAVDMANRKDSVVLQEAADLYGDIQTAESELQFQRVDLKTRLTTLQSTVTSQEASSPVIFSSSL